MATGDRTLDAAGWNRRLERALEDTLDRLAAEAESRDPSAFEPLLAGRAGVGGVYDLWRRLRAYATGRTFHPGHREAG
jgi:hypothetical protein